MKLKTILLLLTAIMFNSIFGASVAHIADIPPVYGVITLNVLGSLTPLLHLPKGLMAGVHKEMWIDKVVEAYTYTLEGTFLEGITDYSQFVDDNDRLHIIDCGIDPSVLIDNNTYPLEIENFEDDDIELPVSKIETLPTAISDDELYAITYDKIKIAKDRHGNKIGEGILDKAIHAFAPMSNTADTPIVTTTGELDGDRKKLLREDLISLRRKLDDLKVPKKGRRLVLCNDHINDLLELDQKFKDQYHSYESGMIYKSYGFEIYEFVNCPVFTIALTKKSFGSIATDGEYEASVMFYIPRMVKAKGSTKMYYASAETDPVNKRTLLSFTTRFFSTPQKREKACAAIVSSYVAPAPPAEG